MRSERPLEEVKIDKRHKASFDTLEYIVKMQGEDDGI